MTKEIKDSITEAMASSSKYFNCAYDDGKTSDPKNFEDDDFIHISRLGYRFVFYNGQEKGHLSSKDVKRFSKLVDKTLEKICICEVNKGGWFFDFSPLKKKQVWTEDNELGKKIEEYAKRILDSAELLHGKKAVKSTFEVIMKMSMMNEKDNDKFLKELSKVAGKPVNGWEFRMGMRMVNSECILHKKEDEKDGHKN